MLTACAPTSAELALPTAGAATGTASGSWTADGRFERVIAPFSVLNEHGEPYAHPFLGGFDVPRPQFLDIDGDADLDLFVQERSNSVMFFENVGSSTAHEFVWRTDRYQDLDVGEWNRFVDIDLDGDYDLLAEQPFSYIRLYRNAGGPTDPRFELAADSIHDANGEPIFSDRQNVPYVVDLDCDASLDLFLGRIDGTVTRYEQSSVVGGVPRFDFVTDRFEGIEIIGQLAGSMRHGANSMVFSDWDDDGDPDLFWGDFFEPGLLLIENTGSCTSPSLRSEPVPLRAGGDTIVSSGYNASALADIDADGDRDLFIGVLGGAFNPNLTSSDNFWFHEQTGDGVLTLRTRRFLDGIDVGNESNIALGDTDGDGDVDLLIGNKIDPNKLDSGRLYRFENTGTAREPAFRLADTLTLTTSYHYAPALGDLDADGDLDLLLGTWNDGVLHFRNDGTRQTPRWVQDTAATLELTRGSNTTPALADIDDDGDLDLFIGEAGGELNFYRNAGSASEPRFELVSDTLGSIDAGRRSAPAFADLDGDGDLDLVLGGEAGGAVHYRNDGTPTEPHFVRTESALAVELPPYAVPRFVDIDGDGALDILSGGLSGGVVFWRGR